ncbi:LysM peptidoglycan-binding domain-containing protein, partial [Weissella muntiaci]
MQKFKLVKMGRKLVNISMGLIGMSGTLVAGTGLAMANGEKNTTDDYTDQNKETAWKANSIEQITQQVKMQLAKSGMKSGNVQLRDYVVQPGDTLVNIAAVFDTTVNAIAVQYGFDNPNLIIAGYTIGNNPTGNHNYGSYLVAHPDVTVYGQAQKSVEGTQYEVNDDKAQATAILENGMNVAKNEVRDGANTGVVIAKQQSDETASSNNIQASTSDKTTSEVGVSTGTSTSGSEA